MINYLMPGRYIADISTWKYSMPQTRPSTVPTTSAVKNAHKLPHKLFSLIAMNDKLVHETEIDIETRYIVEQSEPEKERFVFAYTITIRNRGKTPARLLRRHWIITDGNGNVQEVKGDGVMGEQPYLKPGEGFRYTSGTVLPTPLGSMHGSYKMITDDGHEFDAAIPAFTLSIPNTLH